MNRDKVIAVVFTLWVGAVLCYAYPHVVAFHKRQCGIDDLERRVEQLEAQVKSITHRPVALSFETLKRIADEVEKQEP